MDEVHQPLLPIVCSEPQQQFHDDDLAKSRSGDWAVSPGTNASWGPKQSKMNAVFSMFARFEQVSLFLPRLPMRMHGPKAIQNECGVFQIYFVCPEHCTVGPGTSLGQKQYRIQRFPCFFRYFCRPEPGYGMAGAPD